jgi:isopentenyl phosphate kinase
MELVPLVTSLPKQYDLNKGYSKKEQLRGFSLTHAQVRMLNTLVLQTLHNNDIPAVSISPHSIVKLDNHQLKHMDYSIFEENLKNNFIPVTFGDVVLDKKLGFSICSGDLLVEALATHFQPKKVIFVLDEDGLYSSNPKMNTKASFIPSVSPEELGTFSLAADAHADVTRGMEGKLKTVKTIARHGIDVVLLNGNKPQRLYNILIGKSARCTLIHGGKK